MSSTASLQKVGQELTRDLWAELGTEEKARTYVCHMCSRSNVIRVLKLSQSTVGRTFSSSMYCDRFARS